MHCECFSEFETLDELFFLLLPGRRSAPNPEAECRALAGLAARPDLPAVQPHQLLGYRKPEASAALPVRARRELREAPEELGQLLLRDADARIDNVELHKGAARILHAHSHAPGACE